MLFGFRRKRDDDYKPPKPNPIPYGPVQLEVPGLGIVVCSGEKASELIAKGARFAGWDPR